MIFLETNKAYVGIAIGDLHCGAFDASTWYTEMEHCFLKRIEEMPILDFIVFCGDLLDDKISMNSDHAKFLMMFLIRTIAVCKEKGTKWRIFKGTESHDNKQLEMIESMLISSGCDIKVFHTVESEWLFNDLHVLYIPEEYLEDKDAYYADAFSKTYDMIFGHGLVQEALHMAAKQESELTMPKAPVFKTDDLLAICKGPIFFGHVHNKIVIKKRFHYTNSPSRWAYGEEEDKGYYVVCYSPESYEFKTEYIVNTWARKFETLEVECSPSFSVDEQIKYLITLVDNISDSREFLRLEVNIPEDHTSPVLLTTMLNQIFSKYKKFKLKINNKSNSKQTTEMQKKIKILLEKYGFLFDTRMPTEEKICRFIKEKYDRNISLDRMRMYLYEKFLTGE